MLTDKATIKSEIKEPGQKNNSTNTLNNSNLLLKESVPPGPVRNPFS